MEFPHDLMAEALPTGVRRLPGEIVGSVDPSSGQEAAPVAMSPTLLATFSPNPVVVSPAMTSPSEVPSGSVRSGTHSRIAVSSGEAGGQAPTERAPTHLRRPEILDAVLPELYEESTINDSNPRASWPTQGKQVFTKIIICSIWIQ